MPASWELQLISAIIRSMDGPSRFERVQLAGIRYEYFATNEAKMLWSRIDAHFTRPDNYGFIPSEQTLKEVFPSIDLPTPLENLDDLVGKVKQGYVRRKVDKLIENYRDSVREDITAESISRMYTELGRLQEETRQNADVNFKEVALNQIMTGLTKAKENNGMTGMPWPWMQLNEATGGIHGSDFIMVWALPKSMKTFFGLVVAAHLFMRGYRVLIYSKEMTWEILLVRLACILCRLDYTRTKRGELSSREEELLLTTVERLSTSNFPGELFYTQADRMDGGPGGPADIRRKVDIFKPHFVLLDSSYMLEMPEATGANALDWKNLSAVSRGLKQICKNTKTAMMAIMQENERAAIKYKGTRGTASIAMNTGAPQDCDLGLHLVLNGLKAELSIHYAVAREAKAKGFTINALACDNFDYAGDHLWNVGDDADDGKKADKVKAPEPAQVPQSVSTRLAFRAKNIPGVTLPTRVVAPPVADVIDIENDLDGDEDITGDTE